MDPNGTRKAQVSRRLVFSCGGKGGVGKSTFMSGLAEFYQDRQINAELLDLDNENETKGSLKSWFPSATKIDIRKANAYDVLLRKAFQSKCDVVLADMGAAQGQRVWEWFDTIYASAIEAGLTVRFTAVGMVTNDPASVESVLQWARHLKDTVEYLIVRNQMSSDDNLRAWNSATVGEFRDLYKPAEIQLGPRDVDFQQLTRDYGLTLTALAEGLESDDEQLEDPVLRVRAIGYRRALFDQLNEVTEVLLP
jgi:hypothetical protein